MLDMFKYFYNIQKDLIFVAYDEDKPVGIIMSLLKPWWDGKHLVDVELFVSEEYRNNKIAKNLEKRLFEYAIEKYGVITIEAHTYEDKQGFPLSWHKKVGFEVVDDMVIINGNIKEILENLK